MKTPFTALEPSLKNEILSRVNETSHPFNLMDSKNYSAKSNT